MNDVPVITMFMTDTEIMNRWNSLGFEPLVDVVHGGDLLWLEKNYAGEKRFFRKGKMYEKAEHGEPDFSISFSVGYTLTEEDWDDIHEWVLYNILHDDIWTGDRGDMLMKRPYKIMEEIKMEKTHEAEKENIQYGFEYVEIPEHDVMLYQVEKPFTDLPYTVIVEDYRREGHLPFFSSLYICDSWGVAINDEIFLKKVWKYLDMQGECNLEQFVKSRVEGCIKYGLPEPKVYRRGIKEIVDRIRNGEFFHWTESHEVRKPKKVTFT